MSEKSINLSIESSSKTFSTLQEQRLFRIGFIQVTSDFKRVANSFAMIVQSRQSIVRLSVRMGAAGFDAQFGADRRDAWHCCPGCFVGHTFVIQGIADLPL